VNDKQKDASEIALDQIAKLCGCPEWDYPGQVVRDVECALRALNDLREGFEYVLRRFANMAPCSAGLAAAEINANSMLQKHEKPIAWAKAMNDGTR